MKFATKFIRQYPPHLRYVTTLPWEIKNSNFLLIFTRCGKMPTNCIFIASNFASCSLNWLQINFFNSLLFYLFTFAINLWHHKIRHSRCHCRVSQQSTWYETTRTRFWWNFYLKSVWGLSLIHIWRCRRIERCRSRWSPYH